MTALQASEADGRHALGVDIGGTFAKLGVVSEAGAVVTDATVSAPRQPAEYALLNAEMLRLAEASGVPVSAIGLSVAGLYDDDRRVLTYHPNNPGLEGADFVAPLLVGFEGLPWAVERDINAGALGEYRFGVGQGSQRFLCMVLGTGVGAGMIVDGELLRFAFDGIGDPGYVIVDPAGRVCPGGSKGCLEAEVSSEGVALRALAALRADPASALAGAEAELERGQARPVITAAREGDALARLVMHETGRLVGIGLSSLASIFAPDCIAIAGGLVEDGGALVAGAREAFAEYTAPFYAEGVRIESAALGAWANVLGAAWAALR